VIEHRELHELPRWTVLDRRQSGLVSVVEQCLNLRAGYTWLDGKRQLPVGDRTFGAWLLGTLPH